VLASLRTQSTFIVKLIWEVIDMRKLFGMNKKSNEVNVNKIDKVLEKLRDTEDIEDTNNPFAIEKQEGFEVIEVRYIRDECGNWVAKDIIEIQTKDN
jgi:hypothetical protein